MASKMCDANIKLYRLVLAAVPGNALSSREDVKDGISDIMKVWLPVLRLSFRHCLHCGISVSTLSLVLRSTG